MLLNEDLIVKLINIAEKSNVNQRHSCALLNSNSKDIITTGFNKYCNNKKCSTTIHAEIDALFKLKSSFNKKIDIIIIRLSKYNKNILKNSKPCVNCIFQLKKYKFINKIYYSDENGNIVFNYLENLENDHISSANKKCLNKIN